MMNSSSRRTNKLTGKRLELLQALLQREGEDTSYAQITRRTTANPSPLSFAQQRLWFLDKLLPDTAIYNISAAVRMEGTLHVEVLERSLNEIIQRHEILRTSFVIVEEQPVQVVVSERHLSLQFLDLSMLQASEQEFAIQYIATQEAQHSFDLARHLLIRATVLRLDNAEHILLLTQHHIVSDGWSMGILLRELAALYTSFSTGQLASLPELPIQYADYATWLQGQAFQDQLAYWKQHLLDLPLLQMPTDRPRPTVQRYRGAIAHCLIPAALTEQLKKLSQQEGASLFMTLQAAFTILLSRYSRQEDIVVGSPIANRRRTELEGLIGCFINTLVLRTDLSGDPPFRELLKRTREVILQAYTHQDIPFEKLVEELQPERDLSRNPLYQVLFVLQNAPIEPFNLPDLQLYPLDMHNGTAKLDLEVNLWEDRQGVRGRVEYNTDLFDEATIQRFIRYYQQLLADIVARPEQRLFAYSLLRKDEQQQVLIDWNANSRKYPEDKCIHELIESQAARTPDSVAVVFAHETLTYHELNKRANQLASYLQAAGVGPEVVVGICMERSLDLVVAILSILKAGGAYMPLDPAYPAERIAFMLADAQVSLLVTQQALAEKCAGLAARVICQDADWEQITLQSRENIPDRGVAANLAYVIYTSGSTGKPKGAMNTHHGLRNRILWMQDAYALTERDCVLQKTPFSFDVSVWEFLWPLVAGARLVLARPGGHQDSAYLAELLAEQGVTTLHFVPSMLRIFLETAGLSACSSLKRVICSGEALTLELQERFFALFTAELHNLYGPTEAAIDVTYWACQHASAVRYTIPIGRPIANTEIYLLDPHLQPVPIGIAGELYIGGYGLARGYCNRPELTAERFIPHPFSTQGERLYKTGDLARYLPDGNIEFLGRIDYQVKLRGLRIEPGEIEAMLNHHAAIQESVVIVREDGSGDKHLVAYIVLKPAVDFSVNELRYYARHYLPDYMLPTAFVELEALPLTVNGKLDRNRLPLVSAERPMVDEPFIAPDTPVEKGLARIWQQVLGIEQVSMHDNFFTLGGDSIRSIRILALAQELGLTVTLQQLFQYQTLRELALALETAPETRAREHEKPFSLLSQEDREKLAANIEDAYPLTKLQLGMLFHSDQSLAAATYHDVLSMHIRTRFDYHLLQRAAQQLGMLHPVLRTSFDLTNFSEPLQLVHQRVAIPLYIEKLAQLSLEEQEEELAVWIDSEKNRGFDWTHAPLLRMYIHQRSEETFQLTLSFHHAILDGWSLATLLTEFFQCYNDFMRDRPSTTTAPLATFRDYVALERETITLGESQTFWSQKLSASTILDLPRWSSVHKKNSRLQVDRYEVPLTRTISDGLKYLASAARVPLKSVLLAAHLRVLMLLSGQQDIVTGLASNGRPEIIDGERALGLYLNILPFRLQLNGGSWRDLVHATFEAEQELLPHRRYPLAELQRNMGNTTLFETVFNFNHFHIYQNILGLSDLQILGGKFFEETSFTFLANFYLDLSSSQVKLTLNYNMIELYEEQIKTIAEYYSKTLRALADASHTDYIRYQLLSLQEQQKLLVEWNEVKTPSLQDSCIQQLFEARVELTPDAVALVTEDQRMTYRELNQRANQLAYYLRTLEVGPEVLVGLYAERSLQSIIGLLGILKSGGAYVPLDPTSPEDRLGFILADACITLLLTQGQAPAIPGYTGKCVDLDSVHAYTAQESMSNPATCMSNQSPAYVIYTSGSTGTPKGVLISHMNVARLMDVTQELFHFHEHDISALFHSLAFDFSVWEIWAALLYGGSLVIIPYITSRSPEAFYDRLIKEQVTVLNQTPSAFRQLIWAEEKKEWQGSALRLIIFGGEALEFHNLSPWFARHGDQSPCLVNMYGITETTVHVTHHALLTEAAQEGAGSVIGRPLSDLQAYVLDAYLQLVPVGVAGELYVGGSGLARGYLNRPELTAERFIPHLFSAEPGARLYKTGDLARYLPDGNIEYLGRNDQQVKIRGYRIELGEIAALLNQHPAVQQSVVVVQEYSPDDKRLVAYIVPHQQNALAIRQLLRFEREGLLNRYTPYELPNGMVVMYINKSEIEFVYREIFEEETYLRHGITLDDGACVFDVGANIGLFSLFIGQRYKNAHVYAFEPIPPVFEVLRMNANLYDFQLELFECGLSSETKSATFTYYPHNSVISGRFASPEDKDVVKTFMLNQHQMDGDQAHSPDELFEELLTERLTQEQFSCSLTTLSDIIRAHAVEHIDLLKIDVEKSEQDVLAGILDEDWPRIKQIVVEVHDINNRLEQITTLLTGHGFSLTIHEDTLLQGTGLYNIYALRPSLERVSAGITIDRPDSTEKPVWNSRNALINALRATLQAQIPEYMLPSAFVLLETIPLTSNGKVDRRALPLPHQATQVAEHTFVAPSTPVEMLLAKIWREVLGTEHIAIHDSFFALGGHSLSAIQLISRIRDAFKIELHLNALLKTPTIADLASAIALLQTASPSQSKLPLIVPNPEQRYQPFPLTDVQQTYWIGRSGFFDLSACGTNVYLEFEFVGMDESFLSRFNVALRHLIDRHDMLRAIILPDGQQCVLQHVPVYEINVVDLRACVSSVAETQMALVRQQMCLKKGAIDRWPLFEFQAHLLDDQRIRLHMRIEAFIIDGASRDIFLRELLQLIAHPETPLIPLECCYRDYALTWTSFQKDTLYQRSRDYWLQRLPAFPALIELPQSEPMSPLTPSHFVNKTITLLHADDWQRLKKEALQSGLTASGVVIAAFTEILALWSKSKHFLLGLIGSYRPPMHPQIQDIMGNFNTIHVLEVKHTAGTFKARASSLQEQLMQDLEHQYFSGFQVLREINRVRKNSTRAVLPLLFNSLIEHHYADSSDADSQEGSREIGSSGSLVEAGIYIPQVSLLPTVMEGYDGTLLCIRQSVDALFPSDFLDKMFAAYQSLLLQLSQEPQNWLRSDLEALLPDWSSLQNTHSEQEVFPISESRLQQESSPVSTSLEPRDDLEQHLMQIWKDILGVPVLTPIDDFFELGGNSLRFVFLTQRMREEFHITIPPGLFSQGSITIERLAGVVRRMM